MQIGILPSLDPSSGGIYQYSLTILRTLNKWGSSGGADEVVLFADDLANAALTTAVNGHRCAVQPLRRPSPRLNTLRRVVGHGPHRRLWWSLRTKIAQHGSARKSQLPDPDAAGYLPEMNQWFRDCGIDLMV